MALPVIYFVVMIPGKNFDQCYSFITNENIKRLESRK